MENRPFAIVMLVLVVLLVLALWQFYSLAYGERAALYPWRGAPSTAASPR